MIESEGRCWSRAPWIVPRFEMRQRESWRASERPSSRKARYGFQDLTAERAGGLFGFSGEAVGSDRSFYFGAVAFIAPRPPALVFVEVRQERESSAHVTLPTGDVDGMGELAQRVGSEVPLSA